MSLKDKNLEDRLLHVIKILEREIDCIGPTPLRHEMNEKVVTLRKTLLEFDQEKYEENLY